ncbi:MAG TPA: spherulation-specific family 4 protein [Micromonosporaceae bacterium]|nr:spherulation-specific family 4 protein [Micromonosporaceae bacterium]
MMLLPLYVHPLEDPSAWEAAACAGRGVLVVVNVHNGPGEGREAAYTEVTARLYQAGVPMLGYVDLGYLHRPRAEIFSDLTGWGRYPVGGVFFDQAPSGRAEIGEVTRIARAARGSVVLNPGTYPDPGYAAIADIVCTYEGSWTRYAATPTMPYWPRAAHLVYGVPTGLLGEAETLLRARAAHGLATDLDMPQPYLGVPPRVRAALPRRLPGPAAVT